eukprot:6180401-Amphidinium_carterae.1
MSGCNIRSKKRYNKKHSTPNGLVRGFELNTAFSFNFNDRAHSATLQAAIAISVLVQVVPRSKLRAVSRIVGLGCSDQDSQTGVEQKKTYLQHPRDNLDQTITSGAKELKF